MKTHTITSIAAAVALAFSLTSQAQLLGGGVNGAFSGNVNGTLGVNTAVTDTLHDRAAESVTRGGQHVSRTRNKVSDTAAAQRASAAKSAHGAGRAAAKSVDGSLTATASGAVSVEANETRVAPSATAPAASAEPSATAAPAESRDRRADYR